MLIDDEQMALDTLQVMLEEFCPEVTIVGTTTNPEQGLTLVNELKPDLIFLDIEMPQMTGFDFLERIETPTARIIFVTAYDQFALKAFQYSAIHYFIKPVVIEELQFAVKKVSHGMEKRIPLEYKLVLQELHAQRQNKIEISSSSGIDYVPIQDIIYIQSDGRYSFVFRVNKKRLVVTKGISEYESQLAERGFFRVHKSYLINLSYVTRYLKSDGYAEMTNGETLPVSMRNKTSFLRKMKEYVL